MTLPDVMAWLENAPTGTLVTTNAMLAWLRDTATAHNGLTIRRALGDMR